MTMAVALGVRFYTPCHIDTAKGPRQHHCSPAHASAVETYRLWRWGELEAAEQTSVGYATELAEYWLEHARPTFKRYLLAMREHH